MTTARTRRSRSVPLTALRRAGLVLATTCGVLALLGSPVHAASPASGPSPKASCVGQVFVPQATGAPRTIALRIQEIKEFLLEEGESFGTPISGLARDTWCRAGR